MAQGDTAKVNLTDDRVRRLKVPSKGRPLIHDAIQPGLVVRLSPSGRKVWAVYKWRGKRPWIRKIGDFPTMDVDTARQKARIALNQLADGIDPRAVERAEGATALTLEGALTEYEKARKRHVRAKTLSEYRRMCKSYLADWMPRPVVAITRDAVEKRHTSITDQHGPGAANHCMRALRAILNFVGDRYEDANGHSILPDNPVRRLSAVRAWNRIERRRTVLAEEQVTDFWKGLQAIRGNHPDAADLFELCFLTGMRPGEAARLPVDSVNLTAKTLTVGDTKSRFPLVLPLTTRVHDLLKRRCNAVSGRYVFPGAGVNKGGHLREYKRAVPDLRDKAGLPGWIVYDLRRTYQTVAEGLDISPFSIKALVNHAQPGGDVTGGYLNLTPERLRKPAQAIEDKLLRLAKVKPSGDVLKFKRPSRR